MREVLLPSLLLPRLHPLHRLHHHLLKQTEGIENREYMCGRINLVIHCGSRKPSWINKSCLMSVI